MTRAGLWDRLEPLLSAVERPSRYIDHEWGARAASDAAYRAVLVYPDLYEVGQANQAIQILYTLINAQPDVACERAFVPGRDLAERLRAARLPLCSLESCAPLSSFDLVGITVPYELTLTNILETLDLAGIPLRSSDRDGTRPLVVAGGPCAFNPEPFAPFFDAILIGEGEEAVAQIIAAHRAALDAGESRTELLARLARVPGVYVPSLYRPVHGSDGRFLGIEPIGAAPIPVVRRVVADLSSQPVVTCPVVPYADVVHDRFSLEVQRGCTRGCRFCQAGMIYRPVRERSADEIVRDALAALRCTGYEEVSLTSLSSADLSCLEEVVRRLSRRLAGSGVSISLPSLRVDAFSVRIAQLIAGAGRKSGLTFAPEAATQRLRDVINKNVTEDDLLSSARSAFEAGWRRIKLYFMIGLPTETDEDVTAIASLVERVLTVARQVVPAAQRGAVRISVSVSTFVPKAHTPFQWEAQLTLEEVRRRQELLRRCMPRKGVDLHWHDAEVSFLEGVIARGGRELADVIEEAWRSGAVLDAWTEHFSLARWLDAFARTGVDPTAIANRARDPSEPLPWDHISTGVSRAYLIEERERAMRGEVTRDCASAGCTGCEVCPALGVRTVVGEGRS